MDYKIIEYKGKQAREYPDGSIRDELGRMVTKLDNGGHDITPTNAHEYHKMRKEKILKAVEDGLMRVTDAPNPAEAIGRLVEKRARLAMTDNTRVGNDAAKIVLAALDALPDRKQEVTQVQRNEYVIDPETMRVVEAMIRAQRDGNMEENIIDV
jgi:hypothetical protein